MRRNEPIVASWLIVNGNWSDEQRAILSEQLSSKVDKTVKGGRLDRILLRWFLGFLGVSAALCFTLIVPCHYERGLFRMSDKILECSFIGLFLAIPLTLIGAIVSLPFSIWIGKRRQTQLTAVIEALGELEQPACIASLATASAHGPAQDAAASALKRVTAVLRSDPLGALPGETVPALCSVLTATSPETALVILQTLTLIGDGRAIRKVESLSCHYFRPDVREAAAQLLPVLQQRKFEHQSSSLLLRASDVPSDSGQTLLRPTHEQPDADPSQLLRMGPPIQERPDGM